MTLKESSNTVPNRKTPQVRLALVALAVVFTWGFVLPWVSRQPTVSKWNQRLDDKKIDASALYYAELEYEPNKVLPMWPSRNDRIEKSCPRKPGL